MRSRITVINPHFDEADIKSGLLPRQRPTTKIVPANDSTVTSSETLQFADEFVMCPEQAAFRVATQDTCDMIE